MSKQRLKGDFTFASFEFKDRIEKRYKKIFNSFNSFFHHLLVEWEKEQIKQERELAEWEKEKAEKLKYKKEVEEMKGKEML